MFSKPEKIFSKPDLKSAFTSKKVPGTTQFCTQNVK